MSRVRGSTIGIPGDECDCGRRASVLHCTACGSTRVYARSGRMHKHLNGEFKLVETQLRCQTCGHVFIQEERQFCDAPPVNAVLAKLKVQRLAQARQQGEFLRPEDEKLIQALDKIQGNNGISTPSYLTEVLEPTPEQAQVLGDSVNIPETPLPHDPTLTRDEYNVADRAFRLEWAQRKLMGNASQYEVDEFVERKLRGELI